MNTAPVSQLFGSGTPILVRDSVGRAHRKVSCSGLTIGSDGLIVWACRPEEWAAAAADGREPVGVPWPAEDVEAA